MMFFGSIPALVTPFRDGRFDEGLFRATIDRQVEGGSAGLVPCGTTGEASTLSNAEHHRVIEVCVEQAAGRVPVIAGCGSNDTANAALHVAFARKSGAAAGLVVAPYYNRPNQEGLAAHFETLADAADLPLVLYNVPARTVTDILPATVARLAAHRNIVAIKDASGLVDRVTEHRLSCGDQFCLLSGVDELALAFNAVGGAGCISVTANVAPKLCADFQRACADGDYATARALNDRLFPLHKALFADASPGPVKYAISRVMDGFPTDLRLPMTPAGDAARTAVDAALEGAGLL